MTTFDLADAREPPKKSSHAEHNLQIVVAGFLHHALPATAFWTSIDHATKSAAEGEQKKRRGVRRGVPDVIVVHAGLTIWIELKAPKGVISEDQNVVAALLHANGHRWFMARSVATVESILRHSGIPLRATTMTAAERDAAQIERATGPKKPRGFGKPRQQKPTIGQIAKMHAIRAKTPF